MGSIGAWDIYADVYRTHAQISLCVCVRVRVLDISAYVNLHFLLINIVGLLGIVHGCFVSWCSQRR